MQRRDLLLGLGAMASTIGAAVKKDKLEEAAALMDRAVAGGKIRASTLDVRQGEHSFQRAFGEARTPDTPFLIASITKPMTAAGVMILADRGKLALEDAVHKYIPEFVEGDRKLITIRHLLTHTSGLPDQLPNNVELRKRHGTLKDFLAGTLKTPLLFKPGTQVKYQSMGILLAAVIAERVSGDSLPKFLERELFKPLGMGRTALGLGRFSIPETAQCQVDAAPGLYGGGSSEAKSWDWNSPLLAQPRRSLGRRAFNWKGHRDFSHIVPFPRWKSAQERNGLAHDSRSESGTQRTARNWLCREARQLWSRLLAKGFRPQRRDGYNRVGGSGYRTFMRNPDDSADGAVPDSWC